MMNNISSAGRGNLLQKVGGGQSSPGDNGSAKAGSGLGAKGKGKAKGLDKAKGKNGSGKVKNKSGKGSGKVKNKSGSGSGSGSGKNVTNTPTDPSLDPMQVLEGLRAKVQILQPEAEVPTVEPLAELPVKPEPEATNQVPVLTPDGQIVNGTVAFAPQQPVQQQPILQQQPIQQAPIQQAPIIQSAPTFIQDTTFLGGQGFDPNSTAGKIALAATNTPITQTGDPVADRVNAFIRNTNILLNSTGSQSIGGGF